ncbi:MAG TPA: efflux RND transporter periplasmic adaptor subunit [Terriglobia bacterium]|jgi:HlyD family secretion protein|nr:efflux RND transporter periplasmic adaptor subunit [Terriglobia bacterium]
MKRKILLTMIVLVAASGGWVYYKAVTRPRPIVLTGIVTTNDVLVSSEIQGRLAQVLVKEGDTVKPGQVLALIEPQELRADESYYLHSQRGIAAQVSEAQAALKFQEAQTRDQIKQAEAALASAQAQEDEARADLELNRLNFERTKGLFAQKIVSEQALDQARANFEAARARVESLRKQVEAQRAAVALARANVDQIAVRRSQLLAMQRQLAAAGAQISKARVRLNYTEIHAPIPGVIGVLAARQGEVVNIGQTIVSIINPDDLWVRADVEETYIDRVRLGDRMTVRLPSGAERIGTVFYRGVDADFATQRDVSRTKRDIKTFEVRLRVDNSDRRLWPGLTAYVTLPAQDLK